jgi:hypothetical protein
LGNVVTTSSIFTSTITANIVSASNFVASSLQLLNSNTAQYGTLTVVNNSLYLNNQPISVSGNASSINALTVSTGILIVQNISSVSTLNVTGGISTASLNVYGNQPSYFGSDVVFQGGLFVSSQTVGPNPLLTMPNLSFYSQQQQQQISTNTIVANPSTLIINNLLWVSKSTLGIGISSPQYTLEVASTMGVRGTLYTSSLVVDTFAISTLSFPSILSANSITVTGTSLLQGSTIVQGSLQVSTLIAQDLQIYTGPPLQTSTNQIRTDLSTMLVLNNTVYIDARTNRVGINKSNPQADLDINGTLAKTTGSFDIVHPDPKKAEQGYRLRHCFVEAPTRGDNLYRWLLSTVNKSFTLELPSYFKWLNEDAQCIVSPVDTFGRGRASISTDSTKLYLTTTEDGLWNVLCIATRKDKDAKEYFDANGVEYR